ncbi:MAG: efflux RND transporter periplasmic adaptor subunit [Pirellulaceae bacterium]|nr:efflux RND transporter periplasmic adaptor subunit [Pirellulaceae bacterium]
MLWKNLLAITRTLVAASFAAGAFLVVSSQAAAHENHAPLPTKGVTIAGDTIMLSDKAREAIGLTTAKVEFGDIHRAVTVNARVELPWHAQAMVTSLVPGKIDRVLVRPGETVAPGQELARVVSTELETLQLDLIQAKVQVDLARKLVEQQSALDRQGVIAGKTLLESESKLTEVSAALQIARQKLLVIGFDNQTLGRVEQRGELLSYVSIVSPVGGVITHADVRIGQMVSPTDHLYHVVDPTTLWIIGEVLESEVRLLAKGQQVEASFAALPGELFRGEIDHLRLTMDPQRRTQGVVIAIDNSNQKLRPGMFGRVRVSVQVAKEAIVCPVDAVIRSRTGNYLLVQRMPGKYENRKVKLGLTEDGGIEVLEGVFPGDQVVVVGNSLLAALLGNEHKARVNDAEPEPEPEPDSHQNVVAVAHGSVELPTDQQALVTSQIEGRVRRIFIQPSQQIAQGDVLAEIDSLQLRSIQLDLLQTLSHVRLIEQSLKRLEELHDQGVVAKRQRWELQSEQQTLRTKAQVLERQLGHFGLQPEAIERLKQADMTQAGSLTELVQSVPLRSPMSGHVVAFRVVPGQVVHPGEPVFEIDDLSKVWVKGFVYERDANRVQLGQPANVHFTAYPDLEVNGKVVRISPLMDERMRVLPVWVEVANPDHLLKSGMLARMTIIEKSTGDSDAGDVAQLKSIRVNR